MKPSKYIFKRIDTLKEIKLKIPDEWDFSTSFIELPLIQRDRQETKFIGLEIDGEEYLLRSELNHIADMGEDNHYYITLMVRTLEAFKNEDIITGYQLEKMRNSVLKKMTQKRKR